MDAIAVQVNKSEVQKPQNDNPAEPKNSKLNDSKNTFFSLLKNLSSALEREKFLSSDKTKSKAKIIDSDNFTLDAKHVGKDLDKHMKAISKKAKKDEKLDLNLKFDEEIQPDQLLAEMLGDEPSIQLGIPIEALLKDQNASLSDAEKSKKTLLQTLMQASQGKVIDEGTLKEFIEAAEKLNQKNNKKTAKATVASLVTNKQNEKSGLKEDKSTEATMDTLSKKFTVKDLRSSKKASQGEIHNEEIGTHTTNGERVETDIHSNSQAELTLDLNVNEKSTEATAKTANDLNPKEELSTANFSQMLSEQVYNKSDEIVQAGKIVLRDNNEGTIRLNLQPANLGKVKIFLELREGKKLSGKITVNSKEALSAFEENLSDLIEGFEESGFETANFELSWADNSAENADRFMSEQKLFGFSKNYEDDVPLMLEEDSSEAMLGYGQVNVLA